MAQAAYALITGASSGIGESFARALAAQPQCVLYVEPTTMVDPIMSDHLAELMMRLKQQLKLTSVVVTHDLDLMHRVADRVVLPVASGPATCSRSPSSSAPTPTRTAR